MGVVEKDKHNLTGNSLTLDDLIITWDDEEEIQVDLETLDTPEMTTNGQKIANNEQIASLPKAPRLP